MLHPPKKPHRATLGVVEGVPEKKKPEINPILSSLELIRDNSFDEVSFLNLYSLPDSSSNLLFTDDSTAVLRAATVYKLLQIACEDNNYKEKGFRSIFMLTYPTFMRPELLCQYFVTLYKTRSSVVVRLMKKWLKFGGIHLSLDPFLSSLFQKFLFEVSFSDSESLRDYYDQILIKEAKLLRLDITEDVSKQINSKKSKKDAVQVSLAQYGAEEVAQQLTVLQSELFLSIPIFQFLDKSWTKSSKEFEAPNIVEMISSFNQTADWISTEIIMETDLKKRAKLISKLITVSDYCLQYRNYHGAMTILSSLNSASIRRLKHTWKLLKSEQWNKFRELEELMSRENNFKAYRGLLQVSQAPTVPFLGVLLSDLVFLEDGNPSLLTASECSSSISQSSSFSQSPPLSFGDTSTPSEYGEEGPLINFSKRRLMFRAIKNVTRLRQVPYEFETLLSLQLLISQSASLDEAQLHQQSLLLEPRGCLKPPKAKQPVFFFTVLKKKQTAMDATVRHRREIHETVKGTTIRRKLMTTDVATHRVRSLVLLFDGAGPGPGANGIPLHERDRAQMRSVQISNRDPNLNPSPSMNSVGDSKQQVLPRGYGSPAQVRRRRRPLQEQASDPELDCNPNSNALLPQTDLDFEARPPSQSPSRPPRASRHRQPPERPQETIVTPPTTISSTTTTETNNQPTSQYEHEAEEEKHTPNITSTTSGQTEQDKETPRTRNKSSSFLSRSRTLDQVSFASVQPSPSLPLGAGSLLEPVVVPPQQPVSPGKKESPGRGLSSSMSHGVLISFSDFSRSPPDTQSGKVPKTLSRKNSLLKSLNPFADSSTVGSTAGTSTQVTPSDESPPPSYRLPSPKSSAGILTSLLKKKKKDKHKDKDDEKDNDKEKDKVKDKDKKQKKEAKDKKKKKKKEKKAKKLKELIERNTVSASLSMDETMMQSVAIPKDAKIGSLTSRSKKTPLKNKFKSSDNINEVSIKKRPNAVMSSLVLPTKTLYQQELISPPISPTPQTQKISDPSFDSSHFTQNSISLSNSHSQENKNPTPSHSSDNHHQLSELEEAAESRVRDSQVTPSKSTEELTGQQQKADVKHHHQQDEKSQDDSFIESSEDYLPGLTAFGISRWLLNDTPSPPPTSPPLQHHQPAVPPPTPATPPPRLKPEPELNQSPYADQSCYACARPLIGDHSRAVVDLGVRKWHEDCFQCSSCNVRIGSDHVRRGDLIICTNCDNSSPERCHRCRQRIPNGVKFTSALDKKWHSHCFACVKCYKLLGDVFVAYDPDRLSASPAKSLVDLSSSNENSAPRHLVVFTRPAPFSPIVADSSGELVKQKKAQSKSGQQGAQPYCEHCDPQVCFRCHKSLGCHRLLAAERLWHPTCFSCNRCQRPLTLVDSFYPIVTTSFPATSFSASRIFGKNSDPRTILPRAIITSDGIALKPHENITHTKTSVIRPSRQTVEICCEGCNSASPSEICPVCSDELIEGSCVSIDQVKRHSRCFRCFRCKQVLNDPFNIYQDDEGDFFCAQCYS